MGLLKLTNYSKQTMCVARLVESMQRAVQSRIGENAPYKQNKDSLAQDATQMIFPQV